MAFMEWSDRYLLGHQEVDAQHKHLFKMLNQLHQAIVDGDDQSAVGKIIAELGDFTLAHFATEEQLFFEQQYPQYEEHKQEHDRLAREALKIQEHFQSKQITASFELLDFFSDCVKRHTTDYDLQYVNFVRDRELLR